MLTRYYEKLMSDKGSDRSASEKLFAKLRKRKLSKKNSNSIEGTITETEVLEAIAHLAPPRSCSRSFAKESCPRKTTTQSKAQ